MDRIHVICVGYLCNNVFVLCFMLVILGVGLPACGGVGPLLPVFMASSGGFPARGCFGNLRLGTGSFMPGELCPALLFIVLEKVV